MQVTWRGLRGPATLSKPEAMGSSEVSAQTEYESGAGRKVPSPAEQVKQEARRTDKLRSQANDRSLRDKAVRGGGVKKKRQIDPTYKLLSARSIPQWGDTNVSLIGDSSDALPKTAAARIRLSVKPRPVKTMKPKVPKVPTPKVTPKVAPKVMPKVVPGATPGVAPGVAPGGVPAKAPLTEGHMRNILKQTQAVSDPQSDILGLAKQQGMKVGPWAKMVSNPYGSMLMQMAAMTAIEPIMYGMGINSPILGGILPFMAMQQMPGLMESSAGIPRMRKHLSYLAERGKLALPSGGKPAPTPITRAATPGAARFMRGPAKVASVAIPEVTTVFG